MIPKHHALDQRDRVKGKHAMEYLKELIDILQTQGQNKQALAAFLHDLLTPVERREIATRWQIIKLLSNGVTHRGVADKLNVSIATVTRGSRALQESTGGFARALQWRIEH